MLVNSKINSSLTNSSSPHSLMEEKMLHPMKISSHTLFYFSLLFIFSESTDYSLPNKFFINCGSANSATVDDYGGTRNFTGDRGFKLHGGSRSVESNSGHSPFDLYQTARLFRNCSGYEFDIAENGTYAVRFHFFHFPEMGNLSQAQFSVLASGFSLLSNYSFRDGTNFPQIEEFFLVISPGKYRVNFVLNGENSFAFVNAMEVFIAPTDLVSGSSNGLVYPLRVIHRINVGGDSIMPINDTLLRYWIPDDPFLFNREFVRNNTTLSSQQLQYQDSVATLFHAPSFVYATAKELVSGNSSVENSNVNITWRFNVRIEAMHLVRLHFCDIVTQATNQPMRFNLSINGGLGQEIHPWDHVSRLEVPFYVDMLVNSSNSGFIDITIRPRNDSDPRIAFLNGLEIMELVTDLRSVPGGNDSGKNRLFIVIGSVVGVLVLVLMVLVVFVFCFRRKKWPVVEVFDRPLTSVFGGSSHTEKTSTTTTSVISTNPLHDLNLGLRISFSEISYATKDFDTKLLIGSGGFGKVYKGILRNGTKVAVKRSEPGHGQGISEFQTEIIVLSKIRHNHLVSLIGYCDECSEMILVYEFIEKGTLRDHLYYSKEQSGESSTSRSELSWEQRLEICIGAAKGIHYLHTGSTGAIIHRDIKSTNILLDKHYVAKVSDFGLSTLGPLGQTHVSTDVKGSFGYLDPEYFRSLQLTQKSDVYSFGVVLLEVACARKAIDVSLPAEQVNLADWGLSCQAKGELDRIIDPCLVGKVTPESLRKFGETLEKCLQDIGADRPNMVDVRWDLEYSLQLQRTVRHREPHEDSTTNAAFLGHLPSNSYTLDEGRFLDESQNFSGASQINASDVFSQLKIGESR